MSAVKSAYTQMYYAYVVVTIRRNLLWASGG
jgi:hypothetical protein